MSEAEVASKMTTRGPYFKRRTYNYACFEIICDSFWTDFTEIVNL